MSRDDHGAGYCPDCGKVRYWSRTAARKERRSIPGSSARRVYQCGDFWHLSSEDAKEAARRRAFERPNKTRQRKARRKRAQARRLEEQLVSEEQS